MTKAGLCRFGIPRRRAAAAAEEGLEVCVGQEEKKWWGEDMHTTLDR